MIINLNGCHFNVASLVICFENVIVIPHKIVKAKTKPLSKKT